MKEAADSVRRSLAPSMRLVAKWGEEDWRGGRGEGKDGGEGREGRRAKQGRKQREEEEERSGYFWLMLQMRNSPERQGQAGEIF